MLIECAHITSVHGDRITLKSRRMSGCARCAAGQGCGGGIFARLVARQSAEITVMAGPHHDWLEGQQVRVQLSATAVLRAAALVYLVPLTGLMLGAAAGHYLGRVWGVFDLATAAGSVLGLLVGLLLVKRCAPGIHSRLLRPVIRAASSAQ